MTALIDARVPLALVTSAPIALMRVRMEEAGAPEAGSHVPRIADFTGITFTIHERRAGHFTGGDIPRGRARVVPCGAIRRRRGQQSRHRTRNVPPSGRECPRTRRMPPPACTGRRYARRTPPSRARLATPDRMSGGRRETCPARYGVRRMDQWACWPFHRAWPRSRLRREMTSSGTDLGHTAAHSPMFVQPPKPSASCWLSMLTTRARRSG